jgi:hypothetical protein
MPLEESTDFKNKNRLKKLCRVPHLNQRRAPTLTAGNLFLAADDDFDCGFDEFSKPALRRRLLYFHVVSVHFNFFRVQILLVLKVCFPALPERV